jgi:tetratricopeptide (TPR) repeat protein
MKAAGRLIAIVLATSTACACTKAADPPSAEPVTSASRSAASTGVQLPDISGLAESVQQQLRARADELTRTLARADATPSEKAAAFGALGRLLMAAKFNDEAVSCFTRAESLAGHDLRWPYYAGHANLGKGDRSSAAAAFQRALTAHPDDVIVLVWLGETYRDDEQLDLAQSSFQRALALQPGSVPALFGAGRTALAQRSYRDARQYLERALAGDPRAAAIHYPLAMAYRGLGDMQKAETHLRQRGSQYPTLDDPLMQDDEDVLDSAVAWEKRGMQALTNADFGAAIAAFQNGLALDAEDTSLRYWLGAALYASGDADGAVREFSAVVKRAPDHAKAHFSLGAIYDARHDRGRAIEEYRAAVGADPKMPEARVRLAGGYQASRQLEAALEQYQAAVRLDPSMAAAWAGGAQVLIDLKRIEQANQWLTEARRVLPNQPELAELQARLRK